VASRGRREARTYATLVAVAPFEDLEAADVIRTERVAPAELEHFEPGLRRQRWRQPSELPDLPWVQATARSP
jgi:hypothetical protein